MLTSCGALPGWRRPRDSAVNRSRSTRVAVDPLHPQRRRGRSSTSSPTSGIRSSSVGDEAGHGLVLAVVGHLDPGPLDQLVGPQRGVEDHRAAVADQPGPVRSCSSRSSPTSSSTRSSRVTTPAVPPYSSVTMAIWKPPRRSSPSRVSAPIDSRHEQRLDRQVLGCHPVLGRWPAGRRPA